MRDHREFGGVHRAKEKLRVHDPGNHRRNPVRARHVHVPAAGVGRFRAGRLHRGRGRGRAAGHGLRPAEDGGQARGALAVGTVLLGVAGALVLGVGMCMTMIWNMLAPGILIGIVGIVLLLCLIPLIKGLK